MMKFFRVLRSHEQLTRTQLEDITHRQLSALMLHCYQNVPYYRQVFDERGLKPSDIQTPADLPKLPPLTKQIIRARFDQLISPAHRPRLVEYATGGSTGEPMKFALTPEVKQWGTAAALRAWSWAGYHLGDREILLWGSTFDLKRLFRPTSRLERFVNRVHLLNGHILSDEICREYVSVIRRVRPEVFWGYANALYLLARYLVQNNIQDIRPRAILSAAETLLPACRTTIEAAFQCKAYDTYGSRETSLHAAQCEHAGLYHVSSDTTILEIIKDGRPALPGETGKVLLTDLKNYGMPFVRYQIEDVAVAGGEHCPCGRPFPTFRSIEGRMSNIVTLPDGRHINPLYMMYLMYPDPAQDWGFGERPVEGVDRYQIIQESPTDFVVKIIRLQGTRSDLGYIENNFHRFLGPNTNVRLEFADDIPTPASGKRQYVVSKVPLAL